MQVTGVRSRLVEMPLDGPFRPAWGRGRVQSSLQLVLFEVGTDDALVGIGPANGGLATADAVDRYVTPAFLRQDLTEIDRLADVIRHVEILGPPRTSGRSRSRTCPAASDCQSGRGSGSSSTRTALTVTHST